MSHHPIPLGAVRARFRLAWLAVGCSLLVLAMTASSAFAAGYIERTLPFSGLSSYAGITVDSSGDVLVADTFNNRVVELTPSGVQRTLPFSGLSNPYGVAVDHSGDVFVADTLNRRVVELTSTGTQVTLPFSGLADSTGIAINAVGDVFVADPANDRVVELVRPLPPLLGPWRQFTVPFPSPNQPYTVSIDAANDLFIATNNDQVVESTPSGDQSTALATLGPVLDAVVDGSGDVFAVGLTFDAAAPNGYQSWLDVDHTMIEFPLSQTAFAVAVGQSGDIFVDMGNSVEEFLPRLVLDPHRSH